MSVCLRYTKDREEAAFILNQSFLKIFKGLKKFSTTKGSIKTWMYRLTVNTAIDHYRKEISSSKKNVALEEHEAMHSNTEDAISNLTAEEILSLIQKLTPMYKLVFNLFVIEGYSHQEIAEKLGISEGTSKSNLAKAKRNIRIWWSEQNQIRKYGNQ